ncbi:thiamine phosphate synthase [Flavobacterium columnare NBRC 100251 = ATCC 23463]|uniref:Thiamine-phosphate synthase n=2 Tax=Flavobacterium columnare TaxID=996 RepID=G8X9N8_FLACA|nr:thiamine phosphate synthase [Flavobacterium columnare]AEW86601.1 Thiamine-phosphate pyrophosphorylase [Flavobacterium columnare ATCC 49512]AMO20503.1 thiamine phosphate synthase [Flavobacterium columnare]ANO47008.1 Thiamine-phosphate pyrophosphorylase [Flavobacterium columnare]APT22292.1 thiamine phosphate synthase [Flavobacterium columnare]AUX18471.1 thiamine-phosphate synthase [Flavobacterium columnare]
MLPKIQFISQGATPEKQLNSIRKALDAGITWTQLRYKNASKIDVFRLAEKVKKETDQYNALLTINDFPTIAKAIDAHGLHLGLTDGSIDQARELLGNVKIIGGTANTLEDVQQRLAERCDYLGLGPLRFTTTKEKLSPPLGFEGYKKIINTSSNTALVKPIFAIGGIVENDLPKLVEIGVYGIAVSGLICNATQPSQIVKQLNETLYTYA